MSIFQGEVVSMEQMLREALAEPEWIPPYTPGEPVLHTAARSCEYVADAVRDGEMTLNEAWRFGILQTLDYYESNRRRGGTRFACQEFNEAPRITGISELDAAYAALADHLAERDAWTPQPWVWQTARTTEQWFPDIIPVYADSAMRESPRAFRTRGIWITDRALLRA